VDTDSEEEGSGDVKESRGDVGDKRVDNSSSSTSSSPSSSSSSSSSSSDEDVGDSDSRSDSRAWLASSLVDLEEAMTLDVELLGTLESANTLVALSSFRTIQLLATIARHELEGLDDDELDAGSEESGPQSLNMSSDESESEPAAAAVDEEGTDSASASHSHSLLGSRSDGVSLSASLSHSHADSGSDCGDPYAGSGSGSGSDSGSDSQSDSGPHSQAGSQSDSQSASRSVSVGVVDPDSCPSSSSSSDSSSSSTERDSIAEPVVGDGDGVPALARHSIAFDAELAAVQAEVEALRRHDAVDDGLSPDDETALPLVRLVSPAASVIVPLVESTLTYVRGAAREAAAIVETMKTEPGVIPDPSLVLFTHTCTVQAIVSLGATTIVQGRTALAHRAPVLPRGFNAAMPQSVRDLAGEHGTTALDAITDSLTSLVTSRHGVPSVRLRIEPTRSITLYNTAVPLVAPHFFLFLLRALKKRAGKKSSWYAVTALHVGGTHCKALDRKTLRSRARFFFTRLTSEAVAVPTHDHVPELTLATKPSSESLSRRLSCVIALVARFSFLSLYHAATSSRPLSSMVRSEIAELYRAPLGSVPSDLATTVDAVLQFAICLPVVQHLQSCVLRLLPSSAVKTIESAEPLRLHCPLPPDDSVSSRDTRNFIVECLRRSGSVRGEPTIVEDAVIISLTNVSIQTLSPLLSIRPRILAGSISLRATTSASLSSLLDSCPSASRAISTLSNTAVLRDMITLSQRTLHRSGIGGRSVTPASIPPDATHLLTSLVASRTVPSFDTVASSCSLDLLPASRTSAPIKGVLNVAKVHAVLTRTDRWGGTIPSLTIGVSSNTSAGVEAGHAAKATLLRFVQLALSPCSRVDERRCSIGQAHADGCHVEIARETVAKKADCTTVGLVDSWTDQNHLPLLYTSILLAPDHRLVVTLWMLHACAAASAADALAHHLSPPGGRTQVPQPIDSNDPVSPQDVKKVLDSLAAHATKRCSTWLTNVACRIHQATDAGLVDSFIDDDDDTLHPSFASFSFAFSLRLPGWPDDRSVSFSPCLDHLTKAAKELRAARSSAKGRSRVLAKHAKFGFSDHLSVLEAALSPIFSTSQKDPTTSSSASGNRRSRRTLFWNLPVVTEQGSLMGNESLVPLLLSSLVTLTSLPTRPLCLLPLVSEKLQLVWDDENYDTSYVSSYLLVDPSDGASEDEFGESGGGFDDGGFADVVGYPESGGECESESPPSDTAPGDRAVLPDSSFSPASPPSTPVCSVRTEPCTSLVKSTRPTKVRRRVSHRVAGEGGEVGGGGESRVEGRPSSSTGGPLPRSPSTPSPSPSAARSPSDSHFCPPPPPSPITMPPSRASSDSDGPPRRTSSRRKSRTVFFADSSTVEPAVSLTDLVGTEPVASLDFLTPFLQSAPPSSHHPFRLHHPSVPLPVVAPTVTVHQVPGDGNCLFHTLSFIHRTALPAELPMDASFLRHHCASLLRSRIVSVASRVSKSRSVNDPLIADLWQQVSSILWLRQKARSSEDEEVLSQQWNRQPTAADRRAGLVLRSHLPPFFTPFLIHSVVSTHTVFIGVNHEDEPLFAELPSFTHLDPTLRDFTTPMSCRSVSLTVSMLSLLWRWVDVVHTCDRYYLSLSAVQPFLSSLPFTVMSAAVSDGTPPVLFSLASWPTELHTDLTSTQSLPEFIRHSGAFPTLWIFHYKDHFAPGVIADTD
jgi:hypothetical protein